MKSVMPHHLKNIFGMLLTVVVAQFYALVSALLGGRADQGVLTGLCIFVLSLAVMKGIYDGMPVVLKTTKILLAILLPLSLFATGGIIWLAFHVEDMGWILAQALTGSALNAYVLWVFCSADVKKYFMRA